MAGQAKAKVVTDEKFYIDKSAGLEQALRDYPCVYLEGAAASGKTTAIQMACRKQENLSVLAVSAGWDKLETYAVVTASGAQPRAVEMASAPKPTWDRPSPIIE